jgi:hypothetical protein
VLDECCGFKVSTGTQSARQLSTRLDTRLSGLERLIVNGGAKVGHGAE